jgi:glycosyltransferase involved in cell wall biosynthesis
VTLPFANQKAWADVPPTVYEDVQDLPFSISFVTPRTVRLRLVVSPGDSGALAHAIDRVLSSPDLARRLGEAARERAKGYDCEVLAERVLEAYRGLTAGRS